MNILLYSHSFLPKIGGREIVVNQLARALVGLGHTVRVVGPNWTRTARRQGDTVPVHRYPRLMRNIAASRGIKQKLGEFELLLSLVLDAAFWGCDVVHAHSLYPGGYVARVLKRLFPNAPLVLTPHGIDINTIPELNYGMRLNPQLRRKIDLAISRADAVTAISDGIYESLLAADVPSSKLHRISNGIDPLRFGREPAIDARKWLRIPHDSKIILTVGNYSPLKGQAELIRAMPEVLTSEPSARLIVVGGGTEALQGIVESAGLGQHVVLTGSIPPPLTSMTSSSDNDLLADIYLASDIYVSASNAEGAEGLSLALLDGMAAGLPIVATDIVGNRDLVTHGKNGFLVSIDDESSLPRAITELLRNESQRRGMGCKSRLIVRDYTWESVAKHYVSLYEALRGLHGMGDDQ